MVVPVDFADIDIDRVVWVGFNALEIDIDRVVQVGFDNFAIDRWFRWISPTLT
jgi:hypothetical protein